MSGPAVVMRGGGSGGGAGGGASLDPSAQALGLVAHTVNPILASTSFTLNAGVCAFVLVRIPVAKTLAGMGTWVRAAASSANGSANGLAIFSEAGARLAQTADMTAELQSSGWQSKAFTGGPLAVAAGNYYFSFLSNFGTGPQLAGTGAVVNVPAIQGHYASVFLTSQTAFPASFDPAAATLNSGGYYLATF